MFAQVSPSSVIFECHPHKSPSGALRHGHLLPACTTSSLIFYTGLSFQNLSPSGVLYYLVVTMQAPRLPPSTEEALTHHISQIWIKISSIRELMSIFSVAEIYRILSHFYSHFTFLWVSILKLLINLSPVLSLPWL